MQHTVLQDQFGCDCLQHRTGDNAAVGDAEAVTEFERGAADDDLLALEAVQGCRVAAQYVDEGDLWNRRGADAEVDQE